MLALSQERLEWVWPDPKGRSQLCIPLVGSLPQGKGHGKEVKEAIGVGGKEGVSHFPISGHMLGRMKVPSTCTTHTFDKKKAHCP